MLPYTNRARSLDGKENYELARSCTYDLLSVVVHVGELDTGHYTSYCRVGDQVWANGFPNGPPALCLVGAQADLGASYIVVCLQRPPRRAGEQVRCPWGPGVPALLHHQVPSLRGGRSMPETVFLSPSLCTKELVLARCGIRDNLGLFHGQRARGTRTGPPCAGGPFPSSISDQAGVLRSILAFPYSPPPPPRPVR